MKHRFRSATVAATAMGLVALALPITSAQAANSDHRSHRYVVVAQSEADYSSLKAAARRAGATVSDLGGTQTFAVEATAAQAATIESNSAAATVARDHIVTLIDPESTTPLSKPGKQQRKHMGSWNGKPLAQDPAYQLPGLMWNLDRIKSPQADKINAGSSKVTVAVADTGLDYTHAELAGKVTHVEDFTVSEDPPLCQTYFGYDDAQASAEFGGPADGDWNGHGTWIGGNIAAQLDQVGINGIAPKVNLVALKIAQWCGYAYDSSMLAAFEYAGANGIDVVSMSFGGYLDRSDPEQDAIYQAYVDTVAKVRKQGTLIVSSAGNEHVRLGAGGKVLSHGSLTLPGDTLVDYYGQWEIPAGVPGVIAVSATGNVTAAASKTCPDDGNSLDAVCKPASDAHQPYAAGRKDQLSYYSNYGPRIDIAAPGGARKFNLPGADRGGTAGFPVTTADGTTAFEDFSITSNFALEIPCYTFDGGPFYADQCYSTIQGTSMATPHVSAAAALVASNNKFLRGRPGLIASVLKATARDARNYTPPLSATDTSGGDRTGGTCPTGYCHLGGAAISNSEAYGAGVLDAFAAVRTS